jgi:Uma2 family endonuclease
MTTLPIAKPISHMQLAPGSTVTIPDVNWQEFEAILEELGEKRSTRIAYSNHTLEIMVPLPEHEKPTELFSTIVIILLRRTGRRFEPFGSTTFKRAGGAGVEPDACFYIQNYQQMIGRRRLEPTDPPPDLVIETDVTSKTTLDAYIAIGVPELWIYANGRLTIYLLQNGQYVESETSPTFPEFAIVQIIPQVIDRSWQVGSFQALEEFEAMLSL